MTHRLYFLLLALLLAGCSGATGGPGASGDDDDSTANDDDATSDDDDSTANDDDSTANDDDSTANDDDDSAGDDDDSAPSGPCTVTESVPASGMIINEFMASNDAAYMDPQGDFDDWIELYNSAASPIDLTGWQITDDPLAVPPDTFTLGSLAIDAGEYLILWADEDTGDGLEHLGFKLSGGGEGIGLYDASGNEMHALTYLEFPTDVSCARNGQGDWVQVAGGTPGLAN